MLSTYVRRAALILMSVSLSSLSQIADAQTAAQTADPVRWSITTRSTPVTVGDTVSLTLTAAIEDGFHVYSLTQLDEGPYPLTIRAVDDEVVKSSGTVSGPKPEKFPTSSFGIPVEWYSKKAAFKVPIRIATTSAATTVARISIRYQSCSSSVCHFPKTIELAQPIALRARADNRSTAK